MPDAATPVRILITAEHASRHVPARWRQCFIRHPDVLDSHRAWDPGTDRLARALARRLETVPMLGRTTRLLIDLNRPAGHPRCFSEFTKPLGPDDRTELLETIHRPYWQHYEARVAETGRCLHLACHSFVPVLAGRQRRTDIGLLFDPARGPEARWCRRLVDALRQGFPSLRIHSNQPYRGVSSGLGQYHRTRFCADKLLSAELEISQALMLRPDWPQLRSRLVDVLVKALV